MKIRIIRYLKHLIATLLIAGVLIFLLGILAGSYVKYDRDKAVSNFNGEGPYVFFDSDSTLSIQYIEGEYETGLAIRQMSVKLDSNIQVQCIYSLDSSHFSFTLNPSFEIPASDYSDGEKVFAVSDIESNYKTFRNLLIASEIIDADLNWIFGKGHLVLVGDFIDRSYFSTQVLWFIYTLEQKASSVGGRVHYILGNHEIMNMQGNHSYAKSKYRHVATLLGKKQFQLYDSTSFIGRWMSSKNTIERINGDLFVHGGIHPDIARGKMNIDEINSLTRQNYYKPYYPKIVGSEIADLYLSSSTAPYWYRGYFNSEATEEDVQLGLEKFDVSSIIVGHTVQSKVKPSFDGKVIGIDVKHPKDYYKYFPKNRSEGLLIENGKYFRILDSGKKSIVKTREK